MSDMTASRLGVVNGTTDGSFAQDNALFLKIFGGEVMTAFAERNVMQDKHLIRTIASGKTASFPATWKTGAGYHAPGTQLTGSQSVNHNERLISLDDFLVSDVFVAQIDELKNHYDVRGIYSEQMGAALARVYDQNIQKVLVLAARTSATVTGGFGGTKLNGGATAKTSASVLSGMIFDAAQALDEKDVFEDGRYVNLKPAQYYLLVQNKDLLNRDWGGAGSLAKAELPEIAGIQVVKTNNLPTANVAAATDGENNTYFGNFTATAGVVYHKTAVGTVQRLGLTVSMTAPDGDFMVQYNGSLMTAKYLLGHGILRPECAVELSADT